MGGKSVAICIRFRVYSIDRVYRVFRVFGSMGFRVGSWEVSK